MKVALIALLCIAARRAGVAEYEWWERNRMTLPCLLAGIWGDGGPGFKSYLDSYEYRLSTADAPHREIVLLRHWESNKGSCASADKDTHWAFVKKTAAERNWAEANFLLAVKLGYGDVYGEVFFDSENSEILRPDLGDGVNLDLEQSFALLQRAAEQGDIGAQTLLAHVLKSGEWGKDGAWKVDVDLQAAEEWLRKVVEESVARGDETAPQRAEECTRMQNGAELDSNGDGVVNAQDENFSDLRVMRWTDANENGMMNGGAHSGRRNRAETIF